MKKITFLTSCLTLFLVGNLYAQETVWVSATGAGLKNGTSQANAYDNFTTALFDINSAGDVLRVVGTVAATGQNLTTVSATASNKTFAYTIEGDAGGSTLTGTANGTRMFTINGTSAGHNVTFKNIKFTGATNQTLNGGGVLFCNQPVTIKFENCIFDGNSLASTTTLGGGALQFIGLPTVTITGCTFKNNSSPNIGGAIVANPAKLTISKTTFYNNKTLGTAGTVWGGAALYVNGATSVNSLTNCTFYQNTSIFPVAVNQDYGAIRTEHGNTTVTNCLFYDNKAAIGNPITSSAPSDWGANANGTQNFNKSIAQWISNNVDNRTNFISFVKASVNPLEVAANLTSSSLTWDDSSGKVKYKLATAGDHTPIGYGTDNKDVGAWDSASFWTGTTSTSWTDATNWFNNGNNVVGATKDAVIGTGNFQPEIGANASVKSLTLNASTSLTVNSGYNLTVAGAVANSGTLTIENNANLIQGGTTNTNTGNVIVKRNSNPLYLLDYTMWSSPVSGTQTLADFSPMTSIAPIIRFYTYDPANNWYKYAVPTSTFTTGTGYLIRMPKSDATTDYDAGTAPLTYNGQFTGIPNNGTITLSGLTADKFYSVGNPYPSTISADAFISGNSTGGTLYFWRKRNAQAGSAYAAYNSTGSTASSDASVGIPNGTIQVGQGFIVKTGAAATTLAFTNAMRAGTVSTQIFKTKQVQKDRVWVNLTRPATKTGTIDIPEAFSQALIGYMDGATLGVDEGIDGKYINDSEVALTSSINNEEYTIQGRPTFDPADVVALNFKTDADGAYTIALDHFDGVFAAGQDVYLVDSKTGTETDLKAGAYTFNATSGIDNTRFSLKYQKTLKVDAPAFNENSVSVYKNNGALYVNSGFVAMNNIKVFDIQGRLIAEQKNLKSTTAVFNNLRAKNQVLIVKITGENNNVVSKKIVN